ncbi:hypothetical protein [Streptomyces sp. NPDC048496]
MRGEKRNATFAELIDRYALHFADRGIGPGDIVAVKLPWVLTSAGA